MQAVLCDVCERRIQGDAYELHVITGTAVKTETGTRLSQRRSSQQIYLCGSCGGWLHGALEHLKGGYRAIRDSEHLLHPSLTANG
jgi:ribosomal protein L37AE/L43A